MFFIYSFIFLSFNFKRNEYILNLFSGDLNNLTFIMIDN